MSAFKCEICQKNRDEVEHNFLTRNGEVDVCDSCMKTINEKIKLTNDDWGFPQQDSYATERYEE